MDDGASRKVIKLLIYNALITENKFNSILNYKGRYFEDYLEKAINLEEDDILRKKIRMNSYSFNYIYTLLCNSITFKYQATHQCRNQRFIPLKKQLCVFLYFISRNYQYDDIAHLFGLSDGSLVSLIIEKVAIAIVEYKNDFIKWHTDESKVKQLSKAKEYGFDDCIALVDGVVNKITSFDKRYTASWNTRKCHYGIVSLVICDIFGRILWVSTGNCDLTMILEYGNETFCR